MDDLRHPAPCEDCGSTAPREAKMHGSLCAHCRRFRPYAPRATAALVALAALLCTASSCSSSESLFGGGPDAGPGVVGTGGAGGASSSTSTSTSASSTTSTSTASAGGQGGGGGPITTINVGGGGAGGTSDASTGASTSSGSGGAGGAEPCGGTCPNYKKCLAGACVGTCSPFEPVPASDPCHTIAPPGKTYMITCPDGGATLPPGVCWAGGSVNADPFWCCFPDD